jgi:hypothetical protein
MDEQLDINKKLISTNLLAYVKKVFRLISTFLFIHKKKCELYIDKKIKRNILEDLVVIKILI